MANLYDLKKFDLNLLVIFECIYQHLSISRAAVDALYHAIRRQPVAATPARSA
ncbi:LysR family transcriptional regulator [Enterobacter cloacae subsp. cloacae GS1]|nr:LysR family transcriptional regulator [Enterobacter cloacae subsp. cloacae GS1]